MSYGIIQQLINGFRNHIILYAVAIVLLTILIAVIDQIRHQALNRRRLHVTLDDESEDSGFHEDIHKNKVVIPPIRHDPVQYNIADIIALSTVVIIDARRYAVALFYSLDKTDAPIVIYKGLNDLAFQVQEFAQKGKIPIIENPELARGLYLNIKINEPISTNYYKTVAKVIRFVLGYEGCNVKLRS